MDDWDADDFEVPTLGLQDQKRFDDEDEELEDAAAHHKQKPQKPTQKAKKPEKGPKAEVYVPLDDPEAEKRRRQRLVEESDLKNAQDLFGVDLTKNLDDLNPSSEAEFSEFAQILVGKYVAPHASTSHYKSFLKTIIKHACMNVSSHDVKEIESSVVAMRNEKLKGEKAAAKAKSKKAMKKNQLNAGVRGGEAGLDDATYFNNALDIDDDLDFM